MLSRQFSFFIIKSHSLYFISTPRRQQKAKPTTKSKANSSKNHLGQAKAQLLSGQLQRVPEMKDESNRPRRPMRTNSKNSRLLWNTSKKSRALGLAAIQLICAADTLPSLISISPSKTKERLSWDSRSANFLTPRRGLYSKLIFRPIRRFWSGWDSSRFHFLSITLWLASHFSSNRISMSLSISWPHLPDTKAQIKGRNMNRKVF